MAARGGLAQSAKCRRRDRQLRPQPRLTRLRPSGIAIPVARVSQSRNNVGAFVEFFVQSGEKDGHFGMLSLEVFCSRDAAEHRYQAKASGSLSFELGGGI